MHAQIDFTFYGIARHPKIINKDVLFRFYILKINFGYVFYWHFLLFLVQVRLRICSALPRVLQLGCKKVKREINPELTAI